jgi:hypothetical protein
MTTPSLPGVNVLLEGPAGTGKTYSIGTLVDAGIETFYIGLEPGLESLLGYWADRGQPIPANLHWHNFDPSRVGMKRLLSMAENTGRLGMDALAKMQDVERTRQNRYFEFLKVLADFSDHRTGEKFGDTSEWGSDRALVIDGLSGISQLATEMTSGVKPTKTQPEYGVAQNNILALLRELTITWKCHLILISHVTRNIDEINGGMKIFPRTPGKALNDEIPQLFSDVILASRNGAKFAWSTANPNADLKTRNLTIADNIQPDFAQIINKWRGRSAELQAPLK